MSGGMVAFPACFPFHFLICAWVLEPARSMRRLSPSPQHDFATVEPVILGQRSVNFAHCVGRLVNMDERSFNMRSPLQ